ncbi:hypothetical protein JD969_04565 [Planctomycetota bacterium]|nr:hypothetical protein JD969_04565 [Planctomycetota bacterium]
MPKKQTLPPTQLAMLVVGISTGLLALQNLAYASSYKYSKQNDRKFKFKTPPPPIDSHNLLKLAQWTSKFCCYNPTTITANITNEMLLQCVLSNTPRTSTTDYFNTDITLQIIAANLRTAIASNLPHPTNLEPLIDRAYTNLSSKEDSFF